MHTTTLANNLDPLHRSCFSGCHSGSLIIASAHATKQIERGLATQGGSGRTHTEEAPSPKDLIPDGGFADGLKWLPHIPKRWRRVIRQLMEDDTSKRYQTADQALGAISSLPIAPAWQATVTPDQIRWKTNSANRLKVVEWKRLPRRNEWTAWSEPLGGAGGRKMTLGGSGGTVSAKEAVVGLESFLGA